MKLTVPALLGTIFIDKFVKSTRLAEKKLVPNYSLPVYILMVYEATSAAKKDKLGAPKKRKKTRNYFQRPLRAAARI